MHKKHQTSLIPVFLVYFLDTFSFAIVFPLFSSLILTAQYHFLSDTIALSSRDFLLGALTAAFPLGVFCGAPLAGAIGDCWGRKKTFFLTISGIVLGNLFSALALYWQSYPLLIGSRLFTGFFSGNLTLCLAVISDLSASVKERAKNFGVLTALGGVSWLLAILVGGDLTDRSFNPSFNPLSPFLIAACIALINLIVMALFFRESRASSQIEPFHFYPRLKSLLTPFQRIQVRSLLWTLLFFSLGWLLVLQWTSGISLEKFHVDRSSLVVGLIFIGLCWILASALLNRYLANQFALYKIPLVALILLSALMMGTDFISRYPTFVVLLSLSAALASIIFSNLLNVLSLSASSVVEGRVLGIGQSILALAQFGGPILGALILVVDPSHLFLYTGLIVSIGLVFFWNKMSFFKKLKRR